MKRLFLFYGVLFILPVYPVCQNSEYLTTQNFQIEKKQILESVSRLKKSNQDLQRRMSRQNKILDSLSLTLVNQQVKIAAQQDSLLQLKTSQAGFDTRLSTQMKSGTLMAILIPAILFLLILIVLLLLLRFRRNFQLDLKNSEDNAQMTVRKLEDHQANNRTELEAMKEQINSAVKKLESMIASFSLEVKQKFDNLEKFQQDEKAAHEAKHLDTHQQVQTFKEGFQKDHKSISENILKLKQEFASSIQDLQTRIREIQEERPVK